MIQTPFFLTIYGSPGSGKSHLIRHLLHQLYSNLDIIFVFSGSYFNNFYQTFIDDEYVTAFSEDRLKRILHMAKDLKSKGVNKQFVLVFDDCLGSTNWNNKTFNYMVNNHRHYNISLIIVSQYAKKIPPNFRENSMYAIVFAQRSRDAFEALYHSFGQDFSKLSEFKAFLTQHTQKYSALFIDNVTQSTTCDNELSKYKSIRAPAQLPQFRWIQKVTI